MGDRFSPDYAVLKETENDDTAEAYIRSEFDDPIVKEVFDDLLVQLLNQPNKETLPHVVWLYSNYIYEKERTNTAAQRLVKMLLDCDSSELELLKQLVEKMSEFRNPDAEQMIVKYNQEKQGEIGTVYLSVSATIPNQFDKNNHKNWKSWEVHDEGYWAVIELMKRHGVAREVPLNAVGGTAFTDDQMLISKESVDLLLKTFPGQ